MLFLLKSQEKISQDLIAENISKPHIWYEYETERGYDFVEKHVNLLFWQVDWKDDMSASFRTRTSVIPDQR